MEFALHATYSASTDSFIIVVIDNYNYGDNYDNDCNNIDNDNNNSNNNRDIGKNVDI